MPDARRRLADLSASSLGFDPFASIERRFDFLYGPSRLSPTVTVGGQTYREDDDGRANVLTPIDDPSISPAQLAERRRAIDRVQFMADNPFAAGAYGIASLADLSVLDPDAALAGGGLIDAALMGAAPRAAPVRRLAPSPQGGLASPSWQRPNVRYGELNANGQATGVDATLTPPMLGAGARADRRLRPPGWRGNGTTYNEARGHLLARSLGGAGGLEARNFVTLTQRGANTPQMRGFEQGVARRVRAGEVVDYAATPLYGDGALAPSAVLLTARGSRGIPTARLVVNPAGRRK